MMTYRNSTSFIGRDDDLNRVTEILLSESCRLLTILGIGGIGKTRLALQLARNLENEFPDAFVFVNLQQVEREDLLIPAILEALQLKSTIVDEDVEQLISYLKQKHLLLVLDNFEHLTGATPLIKQILNATSELKLLLTSRVALRVQDEYLYTLAGLSTPGASDSTGRIAQSFAVQLFLDRAQQVRHDFEPDLESVAEICRIVDGSPLAIELAAVWAKVLTADEILAELQDCIDFLQTDLQDVPDRHRSIRAVFNGSWNLLNQTERLILTRLAIFRDGFDRDASTIVADTSLTTLIDLRDKSLLLVTTDGRYTMHPLIREMTHKHLEADTEAYRQLNQKHSEYYATLTQTLADDLRSGKQIAALQHIQIELQNIRAGWAWAVAEADSNLVGKYLPGLALYYQMKGQTQQGFDLLSLPEKQRHALSNATVVKIDLLRGWMQIMLWKNSEGVETIWNAINQREILPDWLGMVLVPAINHPEHFGERYEALIKLTRTSLANVQDTWHRGWLLKALGEYHFVAKDYESAATFLQQSADCFQQLEDGWASTWAYGNLGRALVNIERYEEANRIFLKSIEICREIGDTSGWADLINKRAELALVQKNYGATKQILLEGFQVVLQYNIPHGALTYLLFTFTKLHIIQNHYSAAIEYLTILLHNPIVHRGWRKPEIEALRERIVSLKTHLGDNAFNSAIQRGESTELLDLVHSLLLDSHLRDNNSANENTPVLVEALTDRESQILRLIVAGLSNREIAEELTVAIGTVKTHAHNLYSKLDVSSRAEAIALAHELNLV